MASYLVELVSRTPALSGAPSFETVAPIAFDNLTCSWELSRDGTADLSTTVRQLDADARWHLADPWARPCEIQVLRDRQLWWRGPVWTVGLQGDTVTVHARGRMAYLRYMQVGPDTGDLTYTNVDQHLIVKGLIDAWQALGYGHFGLDTSGITASGVTRTRAYLAAELPEVYELAGNLTEVRDGFDVEVTADGLVVCHHPQQGQVKDLYLDHRNIGSADEQRVVSAGQVASVAYASTSWQPDEGETALTLSKAEDATALAAFGRAAHSSSHDGVSVQATLDDYAAAALAARDHLDWRPAPGLRPVRELEVDAVDVGDSLSYRFDAGLGLRDEQVRVVKKQVGITSDGSETLSLEVA
jgi:hypothetical protein